MLGWSDAVEQLEEMSIEEDRHERWFGDRIRDHWLLPIARALLTWTPPAPLPPDESASALAEDVHELDPGTVAS